MSKRKVWSEQSKAGPAKVKVGEEAEAFVIHVDMETNDPDEPFIHDYDVPVEFILTKGQGEMLTSGAGTGTDGSAFAIFTPKTAGEFVIDCYVGEKLPGGKHDGRTRLQFRGTANDGERKRVDTLRPFASAVPAPPPSRQEYAPRDDEQQPITALPPERVAALLASLVPHPATRRGLRPAGKTTSAPKQPITGVVALTRLVMETATKPTEKARPATAAPHTAGRRTATAKPARPAPPKASAPLSVPIPDEIPSSVTMTSLLGEKRTAPEPDTFMTLVMTSVKEGPVAATSHDEPPRAHDTVHTQTIVDTATSGTDEPYVTALAAPTPFAPEPSIRYKRIALYALALGVAAFIALFIWDSTGPTKQDARPATPATVSS